MLCQVSGAAPSPNTACFVCPQLTPLCLPSTSLVGPFVAFHHQALLIAAYWPEGKGNIAYGANVGSNHTGKAPDQEIRPGEVHATPRFCFQVRLF